MKYKWGTSLIFWTRCNYHAPTDGLGDSKIWGLKQYIVGEICQVMKLINMTDGEMALKQTYCKSYSFHKNIILAIVSHDYNTSMYDINGKYSRKWKLPVMYSDVLIHIFWKQLHVTITGNIFTFLRNLQNS